MKEHPIETQAFASRVAKLCEEAGSEAELERRAGLPVGTLSHYTRSRPSEPRRSHLVAIARGAKVSLDWLATGSGPMRTAYVTGGANETRAQIRPGFLDVLAFRRDWLTSELRIENPEGVGLVRAVGSMMSPLIEHGDLILLDCNDNSFLDGAVYALSLDDVLFIRRVVRESSRIILKTDRESAVSMVLTHEHVSKLNFAGRVVWIGKNAR